MISEPVSIHPSNSNHMAAFIDDQPFGPQQLEFLETHISNIFSSDISKIAASNQILSDFKNSSNSILINIQYILEHSTLDKTKFYVLVVFEERLKSVWAHLDQTVRTQIKEFFADVFFKMSAIVPILNEDSKPVFKKVVSILAKLFQNDWKIWPSFIQTLIDKAKSSQIICESIMQLLKIIAQDVSDALQRGFPDQAIDRELVGYIRMEGGSILRLCVMVLEAYRQNNNSIKPHLMVLTLECLELYIGCVTVDIPAVSASTLVVMFNQNQYRSLVANALSALLDKTKSYDLCEEILTTIQQKIYPSEVDLTIERQKLLKKKPEDWQAFDVLVRSLSLVVSKVIQVMNFNGIDNVQGTVRSNHLASAYKYVMGFTELADVGTWNNCLPSWVIYFQKGLGIMDLSRLARCLPTKCVTLNEEGEMTHVQQIVDYLSNTQSYLTQMLDSIWSNIQKLVHIKFNQTLFNSLCNCYCHLNTKIVQNPNYVTIVTDFLKLLMNLSESIENRFRPAVVRQILTVVSFYPALLQQNQILKIAVENKFVENILDSIGPLSRLVKTLPLSTPTLAKLEDLTLKYLVEMPNLENIVLSIWKVIIASQLCSQTQVLPDYLQKASLSKHSALNYIIRSVAGMELTNGNFGISWPFIVAVAASNTQEIAQVKWVGQKALKSTEHKILGKTHIWITKLCLLYGKMTRSKSLDPGLLQTVKTIMNACTQEEINQLSSINNDMVA